MSDERGPVHGQKLLRLACEAISGNVRGCSALARVAGRPDAPAALDRFGPFIVSRWSGWLADLPLPDQQEAVGQLAGIDSLSASSAISSLMRRLAPDDDDRDRRAAADYLSAIPGTARSALASSPGGSLSPTTRSGALGEVDLYRLLPLNVPPFTVGSELPGTPYRLEQLLGSGGFGVVYKASNRFEQNTPPRAIKFCLNHGMAATLHREKELLDRLLLAASRGSWPDRIVQLYGHSLDAEVPFLVYEFVAGGSLLGRLAALRGQSGQPLRPAQVLGLMRRVCEAVAQAHSFGVVHRDLKPSNFLVSGNTIKLADFGIGGVMAAASRAGERSGSASAISQRWSAFRGAGTPLYMAPEQRQGLPPEPNHDVYSLGVMWYQLLAGDPTRELHGGWADELAEEHDVPSRQIDLIRSCVGYARKRPATAKELLGQIPPPSAVSVPTTVRATAAGPAGVMRGHKGAVNAVAFLRDPGRLLSAGADGKARLWDVEAGRPVAEFSRGEQALLCAAVSPDDRWALLGCENGFAYLWDLTRAAEPRFLAGHTRPVTSVGFTADGRRAVTGGRDGSVRVWHVASGRETSRFEEPERRPVAGACFTPDGLSVASCAEGGGLRLWDVETGWEAREYAEGGWMLCVGVCPEGRVMACGGKEGLALWDVESGEKLAALAGHALPVTGVAFTPGGRHLVSGGMDRTTRLWDVESRKELHSFHEKAHLVRGVAVSADGRTAATCGDDEAVRLWSLPGG